MVDVSDRPLGVAPRGERLAEMPLAQIGDYAGVDSWLAKRRQAWLVDDVSRFGEPRRQFGHGPPAAKFLQRRG